VNKEYTTDEITMATDVQDVQSGKAFSRSRGKSVTKKGREIHRGGQILRSVLFVRLVPGKTACPANHTRA
jgi:hypothetical protein